MAIATIYQVDFEAIHYRNFAIKWLKTGICKQVLWSCTIGTKISPSFLPQVFNTSYTFFASPYGLNGFWMKSMPSSNTPRCAMTFAVYPDMKMVLMLGFKVWILSRSSFPFIVGMITSVRSKSISLS